MNESTAPTTFNMGDDDAVVVVVCVASLRHPFGYDVKNIQWFAPFSNLLLPLRLYVFRY